MKDGTKKTSKAKKSATEEKDAEVLRVKSKKSFLQKELKELTAGEIIMVVAIMVIAIVAILALRDIVREIMATIQIICFLGVLAIISIAAGVAGSKK